MYERLGEVREIAVCQWWVAYLLWQKDAGMYREQVQQLLCAARRAFLQMQVPEAQQIESWISDMGLNCDAD